MRAIIIDDEPLALNYLEHQLLAIENLQVIGKFTDPLVGKRAIEETNDVDLVFLDIQIPELNGIEMAEQLLEKKPTLQIVFVTAYEEYAVKAFELNALDYVLKPVNKERLQKTMQRIQTRVEEDFNFVHAKTETLHLSLFQQVRVSFGEEHAVPLQWRTSKTEQLFFYLVQHRGQAIHKSTLIELLWPEIEPKRASQQLYTAIYHIRKTLGTYQKHFHIRNSTNGYLLTLEEMSVDVEQFEELVSINRQIDLENIDHFERAIGIVKGEYLEGYDYVWAESERQRLQVQWLQTALKMIKWYFSHDQLEMAINLCIELCRRNPVEEEAYFYLMKIFAKLGKRSAVQQQYKSLHKVLFEELREQPSKYIEDWYANWKGENKG